MSSPELLLDQLIDQLHEGLREAPPGHCLRIDNLTEGDCAALQQQLQPLVGASVVIGVLSAPGGSSPEGYLTAERAIELRNRKAQSVCLLVPAGLGAPASSSLENSFSRFDLSEGLERAVTSLLAGLDLDLRQGVTAAFAATRGRAAASAGQRASYAAIVAEEPSADVAGRELWRLGLIPDGPGFVERLDDNRRCAGLIMRYGRAHAPVRERLLACNLDPSSEVFPRLVTVLETHPSSLVTGRWLRDLVEHELTLDTWPLLRTEGSDLERIEVAPFVDQNGKLDAKSGLSRRDDELGALPRAHIGGKSKVTVRWVATPGNPNGLDRWRAELIPSLAEYGESAQLTDLPFTHARPRTTRASVALDIDAEAITTPIVQVRVTALDEFDSPLRDADGEPVVGLSEEFLLDGSDTEDLDPSVRRSTIPSIGVGRLEHAFRTTDDEISETGPRWNTDAEHELDYFEVRVGAAECRVGVPSMLNQLQTATLRANQPVSWRVTSYPGDAADLDSLLPEDNPVSAVVGSRWRELRAAFERQTGRGTVESANWQDEDLRKRARSFLTSWRKAVAEANSLEERLALVSAGSVRFVLESETHRYDALVLLPVHPVRLAWWSLYSETLANWEHEMLALAGTPKVDLDLVGRLAPHNTPPIAVASDGTAFIFSQGLGLGAALYLRPGEMSPVETTLATLAALGLSSRHAEVNDLPPRRLTATIESYLASHGSPAALLITALNPGSGTFLADSLTRFWTRELDPENPAPLLPVGLTAYDTTAASPRPIPELQRAQNDLYSQQPVGSHDFLHPLFELTARVPDALQTTAPPEAHLAVLMDLAQPSLRLGNHELSDSSACAGLLTRHHSEFASSDDGLEWRSSFGFPTQGRTGARLDLVAAQQAQLEVVTEALGGHPEEQSPQLVVSLDPDALRTIAALHEQSDWVVSIDRHIGVELFDAPADPYRGRESRRYILDYAPEFLDGVGHRLAVTTSHRAELEAVLGRAMLELGFAAVDESVGNVLDFLKIVSGRLALRVLGDDAHAREAVGLGAVVAHLQRSGRLDGGIIVPVDAHPELFGVAARPESAGARLRCDLLVVRLQERSVEIEFIEVKSRSAAAAATDLLDRIADQVTTTEELIRSLFFEAESPRVDHVIQRTRLSSLLSFYLDRAFRNGLVDGEHRAALQRRIGRLETAYPDFRSVLSGFVVNLLGPPQPVREHRGVTITTLNGSALAPAGFSVVEPREPEVGGEDEVEVAAEVSSTPETSTDDPAQESEVTGRLSGEGEHPDSGPDRASAEPTLPNAPAPTTATAEDLDAVTMPDELSNADPEPSSLDGDRSISVELGVTDANDEPVRWTISVKGSPHMFVLGIPGQGKSWAVLRLLRAFEEQGLPSLVFDFHGQFATDRELAPSLRILRASEGLPFSPFETDPDVNKWKASAWEVAEIFEYVCKLGDMQRDVVYQALVTSYETAGFGDGQAHTLPSIAAVGAELEAIEVERKVRNVVARCRPLLDFGLFAEAAQTDLRDLVADGLVVDVHDITLEEVQLAAGAFILRKVYKDMVRWGETDRLRLAIVLDEAHKLARDVTLPKLMKEGRKFGIAVVAASQGLQDFHQDVVGNAGTKVVFRTNFPMSKKVAGLLRGRKGTDLSERIEQLEVGQAYVQTPEMPMAKRVRMHQLG